MFFRQALILALLLFGVSLGAQSATGYGRAQVKASKPTKLAVKKVRQKDGSIVVRLDMRVTALANKVKGAQVSQATPEGHQAPTPDAALAKNSQLMDQWLDAVTEPRFMTALATVAMSPNAESREINKAVDPANVRNWAEFVDPDLYLRWKLSGLDPRFNQAIHNRTQDPRVMPRGIVFPIFFAIPHELQAGIPLKPMLWSNVFGAGPSAQEAAQEWLKLPSPDAKSNPWLRASQNYRY
jgi:hypothetical protein